MIRVILVDDERLARKRIRELLETHDGFAILGEAGDLAEAVSLSARLKPDVVFLDISMPGKLVQLPAIKSTQWQSRDRSLLLFADVRDPLPIGRTAAPTKGPKKVPMPPSRHIITAWPDSR